MKRQHKRLLDYCPYPQTPLYQKIQQYSKPIISLVMVSVIAVSLMGASTIFMRPAVAPAPPVLPTPTPIESIVPTSVEPTKTVSNSTPVISQRPALSPSYTITSNSSVVSIWPTTYGELDKYTSYRSEVTDNAGISHMSYLDSLANNLKYAWWDRDRSVWCIQTVDSSNVSFGTTGGDHGVGFYSSLALDSNGYPHIGYYNMTMLGLSRFTENVTTFGDLKYAWWDGTRWNTEIVDTGNVGRYCSMVLDSNDCPHFSYHADYIVGGDLKYARWTGTSWMIETVDSVGDVGYYTSILLDSAGKPQICYLDRTNGTVKCASYSNEGWQIQIVDYYVTNWEGVNPIPAEPSFFTNSNGNLEIHYSAFRLNGGTDVKRAIWNGASWDITIIYSLLPSEG